MDQEIWSTNLNKKCDQEIWSIISIWSGPIRSDQMIRSGQIRDQIGQAIRPSSIEIRTKPTKAWSERWIKRSDQEIWTRNANKKFDQEFRSDEIRPDQIKWSGQIRSEIRSDRKFDRLRSNLIRNLLEFWWHFDRISIECGSNFDQSQCNLKQFGSPGHPKSTENRSRCLPWAPQGAPRSAPGTPGRPKECSGTTFWSKFDQLRTKFGRSLIDFGAKLARSEIEVRSHPNSNNFEQIWIEVWSKSDQI